MHYLTGSSDWETVAGYVLLGSAFRALYVATAMLESAAARVILPLGKPSAAANKPGSRITHPVQWALGEPGVRQGQ